MSKLVLGLVGITIFLNTFAQIALKKGILWVGFFEFSWVNLWPISSKLLTSPWILTGLLSYVLSVGLWLMVLSRMEVSVAYPMSSLGYVSSAIAAYYFCGEALSYLKILGILIIMVGVYFVARG